jgi:4-hydroxyphenylpyruvate dioxygenase
MSTTPTLATSTSKADGSAAPCAPTEAPELGGWDNIEWWVGNARSSAAFWMTCFGFDCVGYAGPETGVTDRVSYLLRQGSITMVVSAGLQAVSEIATYHHLHGDSVHDLAFVVDDPDEAFRRAVARGATAVGEPWSETDEHGSVRKARIATYGSVVHTFVDRRNYSGLFEPGYAANGLPVAVDTAPVGLEKFDHIVGNVAQGDLPNWVTFYEQVFGFYPVVSFDESQISTEYSALRSTVVTNGKIFMPINEPADGRKRSQIQEYLDTFGEPGVQHVALRTQDIATSVSALRSRGLRFMTVPDAYYAEAQKRMEGVDLPWDQLRRLNILVDRDRSGYLLQIFTEMVTDRPAVFCEIIERRDAVGFGEGNFKALFEAIERDQARRGNL